MENIQNQIVEDQMLNIFNLRRIKECLELKIHLIRDDYYNKNEYERNEIDMQRIQCNMSIMKIEKALFDKNKELQDSMSIYCFALKEQ
jgi:hypothetical protein